MYFFSEKDLESGRNLIDDKRILNVVFSGGTYQVEVLASKKNQQIVWPFMQLTDEGNVIDAFCCCERAQKEGACEHLAAVSLKFGGKEPLHVRFRESIWNQIAKMAFDNLGYDPNFLKSSPRYFEVKSPRDKCLFSIRAKSKKSEKKLEEILFNRPVEAEENSIKFSNLSQEELDLWKEGRPSINLNYELSPWADLAKWWMLLQENGSPYSIFFSKEDPPCRINISLSELEVEAFIDKASWPKLISSLKGIQSPLPVHEYLGGKLTGIFFLENEGAFAVEFEKKQGEPDLEELQKNGVRLGEWIYYPKRGFYPRDYDPIMGNKKIEPSQVSIFFAKHLKIIQKFLKGHKIDSSPHSINYKLHFEPDYSLVVSSYLFEPGDLLQSGSYFYGDWAYLCGKGFFRLEAPVFDKAEIKIPRDQVSDFVRRHRVWLHNFEGFQTHVSGVESHIGFCFDEKENLTFYTRVEFTEEAEKIQDLGGWIYVEGKGFYEKLLSRPGNHIKPGLKIPPNEISQSIHHYNDELEPVLDFFSPVCPIEKSGVHIKFNSSEKIQIEPEYFFRKDYDRKHVKIYGDFTYVEGKGFSLIPQKQRLPENYKDIKVIDRLAEPYFVSYELELLYPYVLEIDHKLKRPKIINLRLHGLKNDPASKTGNWILELSFETDLGAVSILEVWEAIFAKKAYIFSEAGLLFLKDRRFDWLRVKNKKRFLKKGLAIRLNTLEFLKLLSTQKLLEPDGNSKKAKDTRKLLEKFLRFQPPTPIDLAGLKSDLRSYQKTGVDWLWFLHAYGLSGFLCDEMGLGKTHQAMALISGIKNHKKKYEAKFLVVCPTSVIYHWEKLIERFLPSVKVYVFHGIGRRFEAFSKNSYDLLLTSYGIVRTENKALSNYHFNLVVFDELQIAKNQKSLTHRALKNLDSNMRLGLSGTPIENRLMELKSLFDLIVPDYLPSGAAFRDNFVGPIEKHQDKEKRHMLNRLIRPFLLRRKKSEVLTELPEKFEEVVLCDLSEEQTLLYKKIIDANKNSLLQALQDSSKPPPIAHIFSMLSKLKQVCNHPSLVEKDVKNYKKHQSGKWELFKELLSETRDSGQKLVVFSQYLGMLDIFGMYLKQQGIDFAEIRGSTRDRKNQVKRFDEDPKCEVFLGSLQAAGVGIDLISASVVIHYDRWWNPAKENQATDRVHRMGQKRGVQVFKLVTKSTIEEHIHRIIEKKLSLAKGVIGFDDHDQVKGFNRIELIELLNFLN